MQIFSFRVPRKVQTQSHWKAMPCRKQSVRKFSSNNNSVLENYALKRPTITQRSKRRSVFLVRSEKPFYVNRNNQLKLPLSSPKSSFLSEVLNKQKRLLKDINGLENQRYAELESSSDEDSIPLPKYNLV